MKKRVLSIVLAAALGLSLVPAASAEESVVAVPAPAPWAEEIVLTEEPGEDEPAQVLADAEPDYLGAAEALCEGIAKRAKTIYIDDYHIPAAELSKVTKYISYRYGELFAWTGGSYSKNKDNYVVGFRPEYDATLPQNAQDLYNKELDAIVKQVPAGATDVEKVLFIHDYLAVHYEYDYGFNNYDAYSFLRDGKGVCQAYMLVFSALMDRLGIPVSYVESDCLNHAWNVVELDGNWYHVDVTWDDPAIGDDTATADVLGAAGHDLFLLSDETNEALRREHGPAEGKTYSVDFICGENYIKGEGTVTCADKTYETGLYADADSPVVYVAGDDSWYYVSTNSNDPAKVPVGEERGGLYRWREGKTSATRLGDYSTTYSGGMAPLVEYEGSLFFADPEKICRYELATGEMTTLFTQTDEEKGPLSGIRIADDGTLSYKLLKNEAVMDVDGEILPWHDTDGGAFSYYYNFGAVGLKPGDKGRVFIAWYDPVSGRMTNLAEAKEKAGETFGTPVADKDLTCAVFVLSDDGTLAPIQPKFTVHPVAGTPAE